MIDVTQKQRNAGRETVSSDRWHGCVYLSIKVETKKKIVLRFLVITYQIEDNCSWCSIQNPSASCHSWGSSKSIQKKLHYKPLAGPSQSFDNQPETHLSHSTHSPILLLITPISYKSLFLASTLLWYLEQFQFDNIGTEGKPYPKRYMPYKAEDSKICEN